MSNLTSMSEIAIGWQRFDELSGEALYELLRFRQSIFVVEQCSPYPDLDGLDRDAWHLTLRVPGELAGYLRLLPIPVFSVRNSPPESDESRRQRLSPCVSNSARRRACRYGDHAQKANDDGV